MILYGQNRVWFLEERRWLIGTFLHTAKQRFFSGRHPGPANPDLKKSGQIRAKTIGAWNKFCPTVDNFHNFNCYSGLCGVLGGVNKNPILLRCFMTMMIILLLTQLSVVIYAILGKTIYLKGWKNEKLSGLKQGLALGWVAQPRDFRPDPNPECWTQNPDILKNWTQNPDDFEISAQNPA